MRPVRHTDRVLIDLHCHSTASDGSDSPAELVAVGAAAGLDVMAITDHDTTTGWAEAAAARPAALSLVRGAEISCEVPTTDGTELTVHLLALLFDPTHPALLAELDRVRGDRARRLRVMAERMAAAGLPVDVEAVLAQAGEAAGRPHLGRALLQAGYVTTMDEAFAGVLSRDGEFYEEKQGITLTEAVPLVAAAGGVSVLAHCRAVRRGPILTDDAVRELAALGLDALEVDHADHTPADRAHLRALVAELDLLPTGSSDYHGTNKTVRLPADTTAPEVFTELAARASGVGVLAG